MQLQNRKSKIAQFEVESADALFSSDLKSLKDGLVSHHAVHVTGAPLTLEDFFRLSDQFISVFQTDPSSYGNRPMVSSGAYEAVKGSGDVAPHGELYSLPSPPDYIFLYCAEPAIDGGDTTIYDGIEILSRLNPKTCAALKESPILYKHSWGRPQWEHYFGTTNFDQALTRLASSSEVLIREPREDRLVFEYQTFAINSRGAFVNGIANILSRKEQGINSVMFCDGTDIPATLIDDINRATSEVETHVSWKRGELLIVDNHRMMHGRRSFLGNRQVTVRFGKKRL